MAGRSCWAVHDVSPWPSFDCPESCLPPTTDGICSKRPMQLSSRITDIGLMTQSKTQRWYQPKRTMCHLQCYAWSCEQAVGLVSAGVVHLADALRHDSGWLCALHVLAPAFMLLRSPRDALIVLASPCGGLCSDIAAHGQNSGSAV